MPACSCSTLCTVCISRDLLPTGVLVVVLLVLVPVVVVLVAIVVVVLVVVLVLVFVVLVVLLAVVLVVVLLAEVLVLLSLHLVAQLSSSADQEPPNNTLSLPCCLSRHLRKKTSSN